MKNSNRLKLPVLSLLFVNSSHTSMRWHYPTELLNVCSRNHVQEYSQTGNNPMPSRDNIYILYRQMMEHNTAIKIKINFTELNERSYHRIYMVWFHLHKSSKARTVVILKEKQTQAEWGTSNVTAML